MAINYTVQTGDTLFLIAQRYGTTIERIVQANNIENPDMIRVGQVLVIPVDEDVTGAGTTRIRSMITQPCV